MLLALVLPALVLPVAFARPPAPAEPPAPDWQTTLEQAVPSIVVIRVSATRAFDTDGTSTSVATGFVVDAERGILLTNRHVVEPGPVVAEAVFQNNEEVPLRPIYRDPVHDFGFYQFDPKALKFMTLQALTLEPAHAQVGVELRVVGNDAGEKISILQGTLARLDRDAPSYGEGRFNDFDSFYYQAASATSGGSSGSPVLDIHGHVIALNAGGSRQAASSFYLPLDRVVRALARVQAGSPVPRGTVQSVFRYRTFDEVRRLGLSEATEAGVRTEFPAATGMLVVHQVIPGGPAFGKLEPGDVIVKVDGVPTNAFVPWEARIDDRVGESVSLSIERGGKPMEVALTIGDLHAITPSSYLELGGAVLNPFSFQLARSRMVPVAAGVWVASAGYMFENAGIPPGALLTAVGGEPARTLEEVEAAFAERPDQSRVPVRWFDPREPNREQVSVVVVDRRWFPMQRCTRDDTTGLWPCVPSAAPPERNPITPTTGVFPEVEGRVAKLLAPSLVWVVNTVPFRTEGVPSSNFKGTGLIIDAERGQVLVDRDTVPNALGDVTLTFAGSVRVPAKIVFVHPTHNLAVVSYDPAAIGDTMVRAAVFSDKPLEDDDKTFHVGLSPQQEVLQEATKATAPKPLFLPVPGPPAFRDRNLEVVNIERPAPVAGGVLADGSGRVQALWVSFAEDRGDKTESVWRGIPADLLADVVGPSQAGEIPAAPELGMELAPVTILAARDRGLPADWAAAMAEVNPTRPEVLTVVRRQSGTPAWTALLEGDLILAVNDELIAKARDLELAAVEGEVVLTVLRDGKFQTVPITFAPADSAGIQRAVLWGGALLHAPHRALAADYGNPPVGVYVAWFWSGSPASRYGLSATQRIVEVDGIPTPTLDAFLEVVKGREDRGAVRLRIVDLDGKPQVVTLKLDLAYWPTAELRVGEGGWERVAR